jgi:hypothetical protein
MRYNVLGRAKRGILPGHRCAAGAVFFLASSLAAQTQQGDTTAKAPKPYNPPPIFSAPQPLHITLTAPFGPIKKQRTGTSTYRPSEITYVGDSGVVRVPVRVRPRGIWRRRNCDIPPLRLNFKKDSTKKTEFARLDGTRLVLHCRDNDDFEQYLLQEFQLYRVQRLLTPLSMDVRLVRVTYVDSEKKDTLTQRYGFILEDEASFGPRMGGKIVETKGASPDDLDPNASAFFGVWQYFIGNTDFSIRELHNAALLQKDTEYFPVAYDFDWSGAVNTRYAKPNPVLGNAIRTVRQRLMRGYCAPAAEYDKAFALFKEKKDAIYALYSDSLASALKPEVVKETLKYFDDFYEIINDPRRAKREIVDACLGGSA